MDPVETRGGFGAPDEGGEVREEVRPGTVFCDDGEEGGGDGFGGFVVGEATDAGTVFEDFVPVLLERHDGLRRHVSCQKSFPFDSRIYTPSPTRDAETS